MRNFLTLYKRELSKLYLTPTGYIVMCVFLAVLGWVFWLLVRILNLPQSVKFSEDVFSIMFGGTFFYWIILAGVTAALTMRLFAEERHSGTIEMLTTAPVTDIQVVFAKYFATLSFLLLMWVPTVIYVIILSRYATVDYGVVFSGYLGTILLCAALTSIGILISSFTKSQFVSFIVSFVIILMLFSLSFMQNIVAPFWRELYKYTSILEQFNNFPRGVIDTRSVVYFLSLT
ncbi:MAG: ABC transporter permease, partial [Victivallaceae bacterium]|nr:ABC transporter permease [Victivallaceae bacterium]